jgi:hypothetical protein
MKLAYRDYKFRGASLTMVEAANNIIADYQRQGYSLTLRQLYYQFVSKNLIKNDDKEYKRLGEIIANARYAGLISWRAIEDRTRNLKGTYFWDSPAQIIRSSALGYVEDKWKGQKYRPELWVEKEALAGIVSQSAHAVEVSWMACRGYMSASEMWEAAQRFIRYRKNDQIPVIFHIGDHDPSGVHMSTDIEDRIREFMHAHGVNTIEFKRLALNMDQIEEYNPPPNPAKLTDSRARAYIEEYGDESWELDALPPNVLDSLMQDAVKRLIDRDAWDAAKADQDAEQRKLRWVSDNWQTIKEQAEAALAEQDGGSEGDDLDTDADENYDEDDL